ncbi:MAG: hypothetical protein AABZ55_02120, partial [Bdellovibrionota bacterium]
DRLLERYTRAGYSPEIAKQRVNDLFSQRPGFSQEITKQEKKTVQKKTPSLINPEELKEVLKNYGP